MNENISEEFAQKFSRLINNCSKRDREKAIELLMRDHPTLQQGMVRFFVDFMKELSKLRHDERSRASKEFADKIVQMDPYLPCI